MDSRVRHRLIVGAAVAVATISGWQIANGTYGLAVILSGAGLLMMVHAWFRLPPDALVAGGVLFGYLVGNRGFAQLHPPNLPLLPAEFALGLGLALLRAGRTLAVISAVLAVGLAGLGMHAAVTERPLTDTPIYRMFETAVSVVDIGGTGRYESTRLGDKPDNNQFRMVWWRTVIEETWDEGRWLGLGFGRDLAAEFLRIYYGDANEDFSARSPHNFLLSVFARSGMVGAVILLGILVAMARRTWQAGRQRLRGLDNTLPLWIASWVILISACFGVILEGPMGAVVFWTLLGLASGGRSTTKNPESALEPDAPALPEPAREPEIAPLP